MKNDKKEFTKAEVEVIHFEKTDVIATSTTGGGAGATGGPAGGGGSGPALPIGTGQNSFNTPGEGPAFP